MRHRLRPRGGLAEAGKVDGDRPMTRCSERLQVLVPHPPMGDARVQEEQRGTFTEFVVGEIHRLTGRYPASVRRKRVSSRAPRRAVAQLGSSGTEVARERAQARRSACGVAT